MFTTAITDATAISTAATATVASPRRSHLLDGVDAGDSTLATGASVRGDDSVRGGGGGDSLATSSSSGAGIGVGAN